MNTRSIRHASLTHLLALALVGVVCAGGCSSPAIADDDGESSQCDKDADCKGDRICSDGECVDPEPDSKPGASSSGGSGGSGMCLDAGEVCSVNGDCCSFLEGDGFCVDDGSAARCADACFTNSDCVSGCCAPLEGDGYVCSPVEFCNT
jgi:hypothetical protein